MSGCRNGHMVDGVMFICSRPRDHVGSKTAEGCTYVEDLEHAAEKAFNVWVHGTGDAARLVLGTDSQPLVEFSRHEAHAVAKKLNGVLDTLHRIGLAERDLAEAKKELPPTIFGVKQS